MICRRLFIPVGIHSPSPELDHVSLDKLKSALNITNNHSHEFRYTGLYIRSLYRTGSPQTPHNNLATVGCDETLQSLDIARNGIEGPVDGASSGEATAGGPNKTGENGSGLFGRLALHTDRLEYIEGIVINVDNSRVVDL